MRGFAAARAEERRASNRGMGGREGAGGKGLRRSNGESGGERPFNGEGERHDDGGGFAWLDGGYRVTRRPSGHRRGHLVTLTGRQTERQRTHWHAFSAVSLDFTMATTTEEGGWTDC